MHFIATRLTDDGRGIYFLVGRKETRHVFACAVANDSRRECVDISEVTLETNSCQPYPRPVPLVGSVGCAAEVAEANTLTRQKVTTTGGTEVVIRMPGQKFYLWIEQHRLV